MLSGLVLLATSALPAMILLHERAPWREVVEMVAAMHRFFGNWLAVAIPLGLMAAVPVLGGYLLIAGGRAALAASANNTGGRDPASRGRYAAAREARPSEPEGSR